MQRATSDETFAPPKAKSTLDALPQKKAPPGSSVVPVEAGLLAVRPSSDGARGADEPSPFASQHTAAPALADEPAAVSLEEHGPQALRKSQLQEAFRTAPGGKGFGDTAPASQQQRRVPPEQLPPPHPASANAAALPADSSDRDAAALKQRVSDMRLERIVSLVRDSKDCLCTWHKSS